VASDHSRTSPSSRFHAVGYAQRDVVLHAAKQEQRLRLAILGDEADPRSDRVRWASEADDPPGHGDAARRHPVIAEDCCGRFRSSGANQPSQPKDLPCPHIKAQIADAPCGKAPDRQHHRAKDARRAVEQVSDRAPDHELNDLALGDFSCPPAGDEAAVAQHRDPVGERSHLVHAVRV
jgi:hypothetical protein